MGIQPSPSCSNELSCPTDGGKPSVYKPGRCVVGTEPTAATHVSANSPYSFLLIMLVLCTALVV